MGSSLLSRLMKAASLNGSVSDTARVFSKTSGDATADTRFGAANCGQTGPGGVAGGGRALRAG